MTSALPVLLSVPHAGLWVPPEVDAYCRLRPHEILEESDVGAAEIFWPLGRHVSAFLTADVARVIIDVDRPHNDRSAAGVMRTRTRSDLPVYHRTVPERLVNALLDEYYHPYHQELTRLMGTGVKLGIDCHTVAAEGSAPASRFACTRPAVSLSFVEGASPEEWVTALVTCFAEAFGREVWVNEPFSCGHTISAHGREIPWVRLSLSRESFLDNAEKSARVHRALTGWCKSCDWARARA